MQEIDGIIYINLDERTERRELFENEIDRLHLPKEKIYRLSGTLDRLNGIRGCLISHIRSLEMAQDKGWEKVLILEDDALFMTDLDEITASLQSFFTAAKEEWDVLFLGGLYLEKIDTPWEGVIQIHKGLCAHAYIVRNPYLHKIIAIFKDALEKIRCDLFQIHSSSFALDRMWGVLQEKDRWYGFNKQYVLQRILPSDIDIVNTPLNRFDAIICIDTGNREKLRIELLRFGVSIEDLFWASDHVEAIQLAQKLAKKRYLIVEDLAVFPKDCDQFQFHLVHFFRWRGREWDLFFLEGDQCVKEPSDHFFFHKVSKVHMPKYYVASDLILDRLLSHFMKKEGWDTFEIEPEMAVFCS